MIKSEKIIAICLFGGLVCLPLFLHLGFGALYRWDESTNALQAYDMLQDGHFLRRYFLGYPDNWETKPPLLLWLQAIFMKLFGYNEFAIRLPAALAALATVCLMLRFFIKDLKLPWAGIFSVLVLLTSAGYLRMHVTRTGDHDALLIFFLVGGLIFFYKFLHGIAIKRKQSFCLFVLCLIGGILTKSIAGLYFAPGLLVFTILSKKFLWTIKQSIFWLGVLSFIIVIGSYYGLTEYYYPGYLQVVWDNELFPRFFNTAAVYSYRPMPEPFHFTKVLFRSDFKWYAWLLPICLGSIYFRKHKDLSQFIMAVFITALIFHIVISTGTYNTWYNAPLFPLLAMIVGAGMGLFFNKLKDLLKVQTGKSLLYGGVFIGIVFFLPYKKIIGSKCYARDYRVPDELYGAYFKKLSSSRPALKKIQVYCEVINRHLLFYEGVYNDHYGYEITSCGYGTNIKECPDYDKTQVGSQVMICNDEIKAAFKKQFMVKQLDSYKTCELLLVEELKEPD